MLRSLYAGVSAIKANQVKLDVIGNNIANVGTTAFKGSRVRFQDMVNQKVSPAIAPGTNQGGVNLKQVGLGVQVSGIDTMVGQGMMQPTSRNLDVGMDGEGYLMVARGLVPEGSNVSIDPASAAADAAADAAINKAAAATLAAAPTKSAATLAAAAAKTATATLATATAKALLTATAKTVANSAKTTTATAAGAATAVVGLKTTAVNDAGLLVTSTAATAASTAATVAAANASATPATAAEILAASDAATAAATAVANKATADAELVTATAAEAAADDAKTTAADASDEADASDAAAIASKAAAGTAKVAAELAKTNTAAAALPFAALVRTADAAAVSALAAAKAAAVPLNTSAKGVVLNDDNTVSTSNGLSLAFTRDGALTLDSKGNLLNSDGLRVLGYAMNDGKNASLDYNDNRMPVLKFVDANSTSLTTEKKLIPLVIPEEIQVNIAASRIVNPDDGKVTYVAASTETLRVETFYIEKDGSIKAVLAGGRVTVLGQIAVSTFKNPAGLEKLGGNSYMNTANSGDAVVRTGVGTLPADDNSASYGDMLQGMLEMSNVDLAEQFTDMIITTRAFQAAGKTITTGDEILQEIINLKR